MPAISMESVDEQPVCSSDRGSDETDEDGEDVIPNEEPKASACSRKPASGELC